MKAIVKNVKVGTKKPFLDGEDSFVSDMGNFIGKEIEVEKNEVDANWFCSDESGGWWQYHKAWLESIEGTMMDMDNEKLLNKVMNRLSKLLPSIEDEELYDEIKMLVKDALGEAYNDGFDNGSE